jgi:hypothetical protein
MPKVRVDLPLSPAWKYLLMAGTFAPCRVPGWTDVIHETASGDRLWAVHNAALLGEAAAHQFEPYWLRSRAPSGAGFRRWCDRFVAEHEY